MCSSKIQEDMLSKTPLDYLYKWRTLPLSYFLPKRLCVPFYQQTHNSYRLYPLCMTLCFQLNLIYSDSWLFQKRIETHSMGEKIVETTPPVEYTEHFLPLCQLLRIVASLYFDGIQAVVLSSVGSGPEILEQTMFNCFLKLIDAERSWEEWNLNSN